MTYLNRHLATTLFFLILLLGGSTAWRYSSEITHNDIHVHIAEAGVACTTEVLETFTWQKFLHDDPDHQDLFGRDVAISDDGKTFVVSAISDDSAVTNDPFDNSNPDAGGIFVYELTGSTWQRTHFLKAPNELPISDSFQGYEIDISGDGERIVSMAHPDDSDVPGIVYVWDKSGGRFDGSLPKAVGNGGGTNPVLSEDGSTMAVGGDSNGTNIWRETFGTWLIEQTLPVSGTAAINKDGTLVAVGERAESSLDPSDPSDATGTNVGAVYVFEKSGGAWNQVAYLKHPSPENNDYYGETVAVSGDSVAVGITGDDSDGSVYPYADSNAMESGGIMVYDRPAGGWQMFGQEPDAFIKEFVSPQRSLGVRDMADDGNIILGSVLTEQILPVNWAGALYLYERSGGTWNKKGRMQQPDPGEGFNWFDGFGFRADYAPGAERVIAGARYDDPVAGSSSFENGSAYLFEFTTIEYACPALDFTVDGQNMPPPYNEPGNYTLEWTAEDASLCLAYNDWNGEKDLVGTETYNSIDAGIYNYELSCRNNSKTLAAGRVATCFVKDDRSAECKGSNAINHAPPNYAASEAVTLSFSSIFWTTCLLSVDGNVVCNGVNWGGVAEGYNGADAVDLDMGAVHGCVLQANGNTSCWGYNNDGRADSYKGGDAVGVSAGTQHTCVLTSGGDVYCTGNTSKPWVIDYTGGDAKQISSNYRDTCILKENNNVECWGDSSFPSYTNGDAVQVATGDDFYCLLRENGSVLCDGRDNENQVSDAYSGNDAIYIDAGFEHACAMLKDGGISCWGRNDSGQAGSAVNNTTGVGFPFFDEERVTVNIVGPACGNGVQEFLEQCDGTDLGGKTCSDFLGFIGGTLACTSSCRYDTSGCTSSGGGGGGGGAGGGGGGGSGTTECSDDEDNDDDKWTDASDPGCWTDPDNPGSYNSNDSSEENCGDGLCQPKTGENPVTCPQDCVIEDVKPK